MRFIKIFSHSLDKNIPFLEVSAIFLYHSSCTVYTLNQIITCIDVIPIKDFITSSDKSSPFSIMSCRWTPCCFKVASDLRTEFRNTSISIIVLPIPDHCDPMPEKTNHTGFFLLLTFCNKEQVNFYVNGYYCKGNNSALFSTSLCFRIQFILKSKCSAKNKPLCDKAKSQKDCRISSTRPLPHPPPPFKKGYLCCVSIQLRQHNQSTVKILNIGTYMSEQTV